MSWTKTNQFEILTDLVFIYKVDQDICLIYSNLAIGWAMQDLSGLNIRRCKNKMNRALGHLCAHIG